MNNFNNINRSMNTRSIPETNTMMNFQIMDREYPSFQMHNFNDMNMNNYNNNMNNRIMDNININTMNMTGRNIMGMPGANNNMNFQNICTNNNMNGRQINNNMNLNDVIRIFKNFYQRYTRNNYNFNNISNNNNNNNRKKYIQFNVDDNNVINIKFTSPDEPDVIISIDKNRSLKYLFEEYAKRLEIPEIHLGKEISFLFNGEEIDCKDTRLIHSLSSDDLIIISVIDPHGIIKVNKHINNK